jgi:hypothetical protein
MYSEERREVMQQQVTSLHHHTHQEQQQQQQQVSKEAQEWQELARREKHHVEYAESSHFSMVGFLLILHYFCYCVRYFKGTAA